MTSRKSRIILVVFSLIVVIAVSGCSNKTHDNKKTIGIAMPTRSIERFVRDGEFLKSQFEKAGYNVEIRYSNDDMLQQNNDVECLIADGVDLMLICAVDGETLSQTLKTADEFHIPVIAYDRLILNTDAVDCYVSFDNYNVGQLQGQYVRDALDLDHADQCFNIEFIAGDPADNNALYFYNGAMDILKPYIDEGKLVIRSGKETFAQCATENWSTETAFQNMQNILASFYSDGEALDAVLCSNDGVALGASRAIDSDYTNKVKPIITGQDGDIVNLRSIADGRQAMTIFKNVNDQAVAAVEVSKAILDGEKIGTDLLSRFSSFEVRFDNRSYNNGNQYVDSLLLIPDVITKENLDQLTDTGLYQWDAEHKYLEAPE